MLVIDVQETPEATRLYAERSGFSFPVLLDSDGAVAANYAPEGVLPDLPREQVPIASNLIIGADGRIRFYTLLDTTSFDAKLVQLRQELEEILAEDGDRSSPGAFPPSPIPGPDEDQVPTSPLR